MAAAAAASSLLPLSFLSSGRSSGKWRTPVYAKKVSGFEEALRIQREQELRTSQKFVKVGPLRRGKVSRRLEVPDTIPMPPYIASEAFPELEPASQVHDSEGIACMRAACELAVRALDYAGTMVRPSVTTNEIDKAVHQMIIDDGAYPSLLGYGGFPKSICTSVNECVCHGVPDSRQLQDGDIINIDVTVYLNGYHGSTSRTFLCGNVNPATQRLVKVTEECLKRAISVCKDGASIKKVGKRISEHAGRYGYGIIERFVGHGIGRVLHSQPIVLHSFNDMPGCMVEGQTFTIEPMLTRGSTDCVMWEDKWTTVTADGGVCAQFKHTVLITRSGAVTLTKC